MTIANRIRLQITGLTCLMPEEVMKRLLFILPSVLLIAGIWPATNAKLLHQSQAWPQDGILDKHVWRPAWRVADYYLDVHQHNSGLNSSYPYTLHLTAEVPTPTLSPTGSVSYTQTPASPHLLSLLLKPEVSHAAAAYNPSNRTVLVVWEGSEPPYQGIYGQLLRLDGSSVGPRLKISETDEQESMPKVAYNNYNNEYMVVWYAGRFDWQRFVYGQRLSASGTPIGGRIDIATATNWQINPVVVYNNVNNEYFVVWEDGTVNLWAQRLSSSGARLGNAFIVTDAPRVQSRPAVAYNPKGNEYLVVWHDFRNNQHWDIWGQRISAQGTLIGSNFDLCTAPGDQFAPRVSYAAGPNNYLVTWHDYRQSAGNSDIYARLVLLSGGGAVQGDFIAVSTEGHHQKNPDIAYNEQAGEYLIVWEDNRLGFHYYIFGQRISGQGLHLEGNFELPASRTSPENHRPDVIPIVDTNAWFIVWHRVTASGQSGIFSTVYPSDVIITPTPTATNTSTTPTPSRTPTPTPSRTPTPRSKEYLPVILRNYWQSWCDPYEPNDRYWMAFGPLLSGISYQAYLCSGDSTDWYYFELNQPTTITVDLAVPAVADYDAYLYYEGNWANPVAQSNAYGYGVGERIIYTAVRPGRYYLLIHPYSGSSNTHPYVLEVRY